MDINTQCFLKRPNEANPLGDPITFTTGGDVLSRRYEDKWDYSGGEVRGFGKNRNVSFVQTDPRYKKAIQDTLADLSDFYKIRDAQAPTRSQINALKNGLKHIAAALGSAKWNEIDTPKGFRNFKAQLKTMELGKITREKIGLTLSKLFAGGFITTIVNISSLRTLNPQKEVIQHIAVPIGMYQKLLSRVISTIETYHPFRHEIAMVMQQAYDIKAMVLAGGRVSHGVTGRPITSGTMSGKRQRVKRGCEALIKHNIPHFSIDHTGKQLSFLQNSCAIAVLAFSGVRVGELVTFNSKSYDIRKTDEGKEISVLHGKTTKPNDGIPKIETWQTHPIAKDALELAYDMSEPLRKVYKKKIASLLESGQFNCDHHQHALQEVESAFIPINSYLQGNTFVATNMHRSFNLLLKTFDIRATEEDVEEFDLLNPTREGTLKLGGQLPKLTPHDFRRSFAVFFKRYGFGTASGIKFQYKHKNLNMSDYYANNADLMRMHDVLMDGELLQIMHEEGFSLGVDIYDDIYNNSEHLSGEGGERIASDKFQKMQAGHKVYMSRAEIEPLVRNGSLAAVLLPTGGYCTNAECERVCNLGLFAGAKNKCVHSVNTDKTAKEMARQRKRDIDKFRGLNTGDTKWNSILVRIKQNIKELEVVLRKHEITFEVFDDRVKGLINV